MACPGELSRKHELSTVKEDWRSPWKGRNPKNAGASDEGGHQEAVHRKGFHFELFPEVARLM